MTKLLLSPFYINIYKSYMYEWMLIFDVVMKRVTKKEASFIK